MTRTNAGSGAVCELIDRRDPVDRLTSYYAEQRGKAGFPQEEATRLAYINAKKRWPIIRACFAESVHHLANAVYKSQVYQDGPIDYKEWMNRIINPHFKGRRWQWRWYYSKWFMAVLRERAALKLHRRANKLYGNAMERLGAVNRQYYLLRFARD